MRVLLVIILLIPICSGLNISVDYPERMEVGVESEFEIEILNSSNDLYDVKIDIIQNGKRVSQILDDGDFKSSMYYLKDAIRDEATFSLRVNEAEPEGAEVIFKLRDSKGKVYTFRDYEIFVSPKQKSAAELVSKEPDSEEEEEEEEEESGSQITQIDADSEKGEKKEKEEKEEIEDIEVKMVSINPKTIKTDKNSQVHKIGTGKYLFFVFSFVLLILYFKKPRKKKNEFRY